MCDTLTHPAADAAGMADHDHEAESEAQLQAALISDLGSDDQEVALRLAEVEAQLATARALTRIANVLERTEVRIEHEQPSSSHGWTESEP